MSKRTLLVAMRCVVLLVALVLATSGGSLLGGTHAAGAAPPPVRIMAAGDSITFGVIGGRPIDGTLGGYRTRLQARLNAVGTPFDMVGMLKSGPPTIDPDHEGWPGWRISQVDMELRRAVPEYRPDYLILLAGTNDVEQDARGGGEPLGGAPDRLRSLLFRVWAAWPVRRVFVSTLPPITLGYVPDAAGRVGWLNGEIRRVVAELRAAGRPIEVVEGAMLSPSELSDGVHPTQAGYDFLGDLWANALTPHLVPPSGCAPRPPVATVVQRRAAGELSVSLRTPRVIRELRFGNVENALVQERRVEDHEASFVLRRTGPGAVTLPIILIDECGEWPTFVGGGAGAF